MEKTTSYEKALFKAAAYCSKAEHCISEIKKKLIAWNCSEEDTEKIIKYLITEKYINEERYCRSFIRDKFRFSKWGKDKIKYNLKMKSIREDVFIDILDEEIEDENYSEILTELLKSKMRTVKYKSDFELRAKLYQFARSRGFSSNDITKAIDSLNLKEEF